MCIVFLSRGGYTMETYSQIKKELKERKANLEHRMKLMDDYGLISTMSYSTGELSQYDNHPADTATDLYEREKDLALFENLERELQDIEYALQKMEEGSYGICEITGEKIPLERLMVNPTARTVVEHSKGEVSDHRPVEEEILETFDHFNLDGEDSTQFDAEDAWQAVASFNELDMVFEDSSLDKTGELIGYVEELEAFVSTDIHGYRGDEFVEFQRNIHYDQYLNEK